MLKTIIKDFKTQSHTRSAHIGFKELGKDIEYYQIDGTPDKYITRMHVDMKKDTECFPVGKTTDDKILFRSPDLDTYWVVRRDGFCINTRNPMGLDIARYV